LDNLYGQIYAIAAGIADGQGFGSNTRAGLITRGLAEMTRIGVAYGANPLTFLTLAGVGDLFLTCSSMTSRVRVSSINGGWAAG
jgi:glycerol-3-phosphate dehydrogenase